MMKSFVIIYLLLTCSLLKADKPNIVIFLADDLGYGSINAYGASKAFVHTPNLNQLAQEGMLFRDGYATGSVCSPTRYALLTGRYSWRTDLKAGVVSKNDPMLIAPGTKTIASYLREQGYRTAAIGKWHLGYREERFKNLLGTIEYGPLQVGFDYHFGVPNNLDDTHKVYIENDHIYGLRSDEIEPYGSSFYGGKPYVGYDAEQRKTAEVMDVTLDRAIDWIDQESGQPFFLYFGAVAVHNPIVPSKHMKGKSGSGLYGDFIQDVDRVAGRLIEALKARGLTENTLFIFTSDNGGDILKRPGTPQHIAYDMGFNFNGPIRGDKATIYDGGLKVPFIVKWPKEIKGGQTSNALVSTVDLFATFADIVNGEVPPAEEAAPDSFSFWSVLQDPSAQALRSHLVNRDVNGVHAFRHGQWKYIEGISAAGGNPMKRRTVEEALYNIEQDPEEQHNLINEYPEVALSAKARLVKLREAPASRL
ncbi:MAG: arylsulfatase [Opitutae bacterium]|nr:arylsulfatase [Opitutae bacterium]